MKRIAFALAWLPLLAHGAELRVAAETTLTGFVYPESCAYDPQAKAIYVGEFGGEKLDPAGKDGKGSVARVSVDGHRVERRFFAGTADKPMNRPKGIWVRGERMWVTDIDGVWIFDTQTKKGRKLDLPLGFANDPAVMDGALYVTDNRNDKLVRVEPADFLDDKVQPRVSVVFEGAGVMPNGIFPGKDGKLLIVGFQAADKPKGIYSVDRSGKVEPLSEPLGRLDGVHELADGSLLITNWNTSSLFQWSKRTGVLHLAKGFKGPADFCVVPGRGNAMTVIVPDLPGRSLRFLQVR